jgi:hypothetical protein
MCGFFNLLHQKFPDSYLDKTETILRQFFCKHYQEQYNILKIALLYELRE